MAGPRRGHLHLLSLGLLTVVAGPGHILRRVGHVPATFIFSLWLEALWGDLLAPIEVVTQGIRPVFDVFFLCLIRFEFLTELVALMIIVLGHNS